MQISRRDALVGASAAAVVGVPTVVLASASDARIFVLVEEHDRTLAEMDKARDRWAEAAVERMPPHLRHVDILDSKVSRSVQHEALNAISEACKHPEIKALEVGRDRLKERCHELAGQLSQTEATTLEGVRAKMRFVTRPGHHIDDDIIRSVAADLERLAGEARS